MVAVSAEWLEVDTAFKFCSTGNCDDDTRGGGVWSPIAGYGGSVFVTTGNTRFYDELWPDGTCCQPNPPEPCPNHGLAMLRLEATTGRIVWEHRPVPFELDLDPDWAAGATIFAARCGTFAVSTQKDGWTHAVRFGSGAPTNTVPADKCFSPNIVLGAPAAWAFPPQPLPFHDQDGTTHPDTQYKRPGAALYDSIYVTTAAGWSTKYGNLRAGYGRLHAFDVCGGGRLRWILDVPGLTPKCQAPPAWTRGQHLEQDEEVRNCMGPPTTAGGIVFVATGGGHLVAVGDPETGVPFAKRCALDLALANCSLLGPEYVVAEPGVILDLDLHAGPIFTEPVLVDGRVYVATDGGRIVLLRKPTGTLPPPAH